MTDGLQLALICVAMIGPFALAALVILNRHRLPRRRPLYAQRVLVQLDDGSAVAGLLTREVPGFYVVENARHLENGGEVVVDGAAWLPTERVRWIQVEGGKS